MDEIVVDSLEDVRRCYTEVCEDMQQGILDALRYGKDFEFDEKRLGRFESAVEDLAVAAAIASIEGSPPRPDFPQEEK